MHIIATPLCNALFSVPDESTFRVGYSDVNPLKAHIQGGLENEAENNNETSNKKLTQEPNINVDTIHHYELIRCHQTQERTK